MLGFLLFTGNPPDCVITKQTHCARITATMCLNLPSIACAGPTWDAVGVSFLITSACSLTTGATNLTQLTPLGKKTQKHCTVL